MLLAKTIFFFTLQIRSHDYMTTKVKQPSSKSIYRLFAMDLFSTESKAFHVAKSLTLPPTGGCQWLQGCCHHHRGAATWCTN